MMLSSLSIEVFSPVLLFGGAGLTLWYLKRRVSEDRELEKQIQQFEWTGSVTTSIRRGGLLSDLFSQLLSLRSEYGVDVTRSVSLILCGVRFSKSNSTKILDAFLRLCTQLILCSLCVWGLGVTSLLLGLVQTFPFALLTLWHAPFIFIPAILLVLMPKFMLKDLLLLWRKVFLFALQIQKPGPIECSPSASALKSYQVKKRLIRASALSVFEEQFSRLQRRLWQGGDVADSLIALEEQLRFYYQSQQSACITVAKSVGLIVMIFGVLPSYFFAVYSIFEALLAS